MPKYQMTTELCSDCSRIDFTPGFFGSHPIGSYAEVLSKARSLGPGRGGCSGCAFFCATLRSSQNLSSTVSPSDDLILECYGPSLCIRHPDGMDGFRSGGFRSYAYAVDLDLCTRDGNSDPNPRKHIYPKLPVPDDPSDTRCFHGVKTWIDQCSKHLGCPKLTSAQLPSRVIEVPSDPSAAPKLLISKGKVGQYTILSHCWGKKVPAKLTTPLITEYEQAISLALLPRSFKDAIEVTRKLGYRYLWIDALCIIQDNVDDWEHEAPMMASYYGLSSLMISATAAKDSCEGFLTRRNVIFSPGLGEEKKFSLRYGVIRPDTDIAASVLSSRGWAAQERMLAPRIIHYTQRQMIWECAEGLVSEASGLDILNLPGSHYYPILQKRRLQPLLTEALMGASDRFRIPLNRSLNFLDATRNDIPRSLQAWHECVEAYSLRNLTVASDKLHAVAGIATLLNKNRSLGLYLAGIWSKHLADHLAWKRHKDYLSPQKNYRAPSWSWASLDGRVIFVGRERQLDIYQTQSPRYKCHSYRTKQELVRLFGLKLIEQHIVLKNKSSICGAVLEGSYIIVEGACIKYAALDRLLLRISVKANGRHPSLIGDKNGDAADDSLEAQSRSWKPPKWQLYVDDFDSEGLTSAHYFCMYLMTFSDHVDVLVLTWIDRKARVAKRVGLMQVVMQENDHFYDVDHDIHAADWEIWTLKLI